MFMIVHERNAPNNAFRFDIIKYKAIGRIGIEFFNPSWPDPEVDGIKPNEWRTAKLEVDLHSAIELRNALTAAIDDILLNNAREMDEALRKAKTLKGEHLKNHCDAFITSNFLRDKEAEDGHGDA